MKKDLLTLYAAALSKVEGQHVVESALPKVLDTQFSADDIDKLKIIAIGKAADAMLQGALSCLHGSENRSLLITKYGHVSLKSRADVNIRCIESTHPVPDETSLSAGRELVEFLQANDVPCLFLISGGASSLVEMLGDDWDLQELQALTQWMLANAFSIEQMNAVRSRVSRLKGGGLWRMLEGHDEKDRKVVCLMISDVPEDDVSVIGSGLLFPPQSSQVVPDSLPKQWLEKLALPVKIKPPTSFYWEIVGSNKQARQAAADHAQAIGYKTRVFDELLRGDAVATARQCVQLAKEHPDTVVIWGAETTVILPDNPGKGGRNQHLALAAAIEIAGEPENGDCVLLSVGTDGTDGMTNDAGAIVDGGSVERGEVAGLKAEISLQQADSGHFLYASGDLISTGVTGTNVMDLIIAYCARKPINNEKQKNQ